MIKFTTMRTLAFLALTVIAAPLASAGDSGMDILNSGMTAAFNAKKATASYISIEEAEGLCKKAACDAGYCDTAITCNELKYDIFFSGCMAYFKK